MATNEGRFLITDDVLDVQYLFTDTNLDLVLVKPTGDTLSAEDVAADPQSAFYTFDPEVKRLDELTEKYVREDLPGLTLMGSGLQYDPEAGAIRTDSMEHVDSGTIWPFIGPLACSWPTSGVANFRGERLPQMILRPTKTDVYELNKRKIQRRLFWSTLATLSLQVQARTSVLQEPFDRVFFANQPWATLHGVTRTSESRTAYTYDNRLDMHPDFRTPAFERRTRRIRQKIIDDNNRV